MAKITIDNTEYEVDDKVAGAFVTLKDKAIENQKLIDEAVQKKVEEFERVTLLKDAGLTEDEAKDFSNDYLRGMLAVKGKATQTPTYKTATQDFSDITIEL
jgi:hypothetical protein